MLELTIDGMTCAHCVRAVSEALGSVPRVQAVAVDLPSGQVRIDGDPDLAAVTSAVEDEGYTVRHPTKSR